LDDRRDIDKVALCDVHFGPSVSCQEFKPKNGYADASDERFCINCTNFDDVKGIPVCAKDNRPGVACGSFRNKIKN
jgi:hypothetical protein